jgi:hypothetical protein
MKKITGEVGKHFGDWTVLAEARPGPSGERRYRCRCTCGTTSTVQATALRTGRSTCCKECGMRTALVHGGATRGDTDPVYAIWCKITQRATNPRGKDRKTYLRHGKPLGVDRAFLGPHGFEHFRDELGPRPTPQHSVDRIDNDRGYYSGNVKWATAKQQAANRRTSVAGAVAARPARGLLGDLFRRG